MAGIQGEAFQAKCREREAGVLRSGVSGWHAVSCPLVSWASPYGNSSGWAHCGYTVPLPLSTSCNSRMVTFFLMLSIISKYVIHMES